MPTYDYRCDACGEVTERREPGTDLQAILCPECGKVAPRVAVYRSQHIICETGPKGGR